MVIAADWFYREGPGIPKDQPKREGLALFAATVWREITDLFKLNLLLVLFCLPVVTVPAAHAAAIRLNLSMLRDEPLFLLRDFLRAFRALFLRATLAGIALLSLLALCGYAGFIYGQLALHNLVYVAPFALASAAGVFVLMFGVHLFVLIAEAPFPVVRLVRLALLATLARPLPVLGGLGFVAALWLVHVLLYPASILMPALFNFSLGTLALSFAGLGACDCIVATNGSAQRRAPYEIPFAAVSQTGGEEPCETC